MRSRSTRAALVGALALALVVAGCGSTTKNSSPPRSTTSSTSHSSTTTSRSSTTEPTSTTLGEPTTTVSPTTPPTTRPTATTAPTTVASPTTVAPATTTSTAKPGQINLTIDNNDGVVDATVGDLVVATLDSTYWGFSTPAGSVLVPVGSPVYTPAPVGQCVPGEGCGTVVATYRAAAAGSANVVASRTTCGEALLCTGNNGSYSVDVVVSAG